MENAMGICLSLAMTGTGQEKKKVGKIESKTAAHGIWELMCSMHEKTA